MMSQLHQDKHTLTPAFAEKKCTEGKQLCQNVLHLFLLVTRWLVSNRALLFLLNNWFRLIYIWKSCMQISCSHQNIDWCKVELCVSAWTWPLPSDLCTTSVFHNIQGLSWKPLSEQYEITELKTRIPGQMSRHATKQKSKSWYSALLPCAGRRFLLNECWMKWQELQIVLQAVYCLGTSVHVLVSLVNAL